MIGMAIGGFVGIIVGCGVIVLIEKLKQNKAKKEP